MSYPLGITVDRYGIPHLVYYDLKADPYTGFAIRYASVANEKWSIQHTYGTNITAFRFYGIAVAKDGEVHTVYNKENAVSGLYELMWARGQGTSWSTTEVASVVEDGAFALDGNGHPHIIYRSGTNNNIIHMSNVTGAWKKTNLVLGLIWSLRLSLAIDPKDMLHVAYWSKKQQGVTYLAGKDSTSWTKQLELGTGDLTMSFHPIVAVDSKGGGHLLSSSTNKQLEYRTLVPGKGWHPEVLPVAGNHQPVCAAILMDSQDRPHVVHDGAAGIVHLVRAGGSWTAAHTVPGFKWGQPGQTICPLAAMGPDDSLHLTWSDAGGIVYTRLCPEP